MRTTTEAEPIPPGPGILRRARQVLRRWALLVHRPAAIALAGARLPALIILAAGVVRFARLGTPPEIIPLDETHYVPNALGLLRHGADLACGDEPEICSPEKMSPTFTVHPLVGKWLIAAGIKVFGHDAFGWRAAAALFGSLSVLVIYLIAKRLWGSRALAAAAAILLGVEGLQFVQSRLAMLDIFPSFFILLGVWLLLEDRARSPGRRGPRWWRIGSGAAFGLAVASKWSAIPVLPVVAGVAFAWEVVRIRDERAARAAAAPTTPPGTPAEEGSFPPDAGPQPGLARPLAGQALRLAGTFALLPAMIYVGSYGSWFASTKRYVPPRCNDTVSVEGLETSKPKAGLDLWWCYQREILAYHWNLDPRDEKGNPLHTYMSQAWSWPWISRPTAHHFTSTGSGETLRDAEILGLPNPVVWWAGFFIALPACVWWMTRRRDQTAALLVVLFAPLVLPWFVTTRPLFMFYMTPAVPFLVLMVVHAMQRWRLRALAVAFVLLAVAAFAYFYPVLAAVELPEGGLFGWRSRIWFGHWLPNDCGSAGVKLLCWI